MIAVVVTLSLNWVGLLVINSLLILPAAGARNIAKNMRQYMLFSVLSALLCSIAGLFVSYEIGCSTGATISLLLSAFFGLSLFFRSGRQA